MACHDEVTYHTHYTEFNLYKDAATNQASAGRVDWSQGPFFKWVDESELGEKIEVKKYFWNLPYRPQWNSN